MRIEYSKPVSLRNVAAILATILLATASDASFAADAVAPPKVAFFGFALINTSPQPTTLAEEARLRMLDDLLREKLAASGRYAVVAIAPALAAEIAAGAEIRDCNGCERGYALRAGADRAAWGTVQKVSNLILNINLYIEDARSGRMEFVRSVDIRGNTDESWRHGLDYMLRHYLFAEP